MWAWGVFSSAAPALVLSRHCEPGVGVPMGPVPPDSIAYPLPSICGGVLEGRASPISPPDIAEFCFRSVQDPVSSPVSLLPLPHGWMALFLLYLLHWSTFAWDWGGGFCPSPGRSGLCLIVHVKWSGCLGTTKRGGSPGFSPWPSCFLVTSPVENHGKELVSDYGHPLCLGSLRFYTVILTHTQF